MEFKVTHYRIPSLTPLSIIQVFLFHAHLIYTHWLSLLSVQYLFTLSAKAALHVCLSYLITPTPPTHMLDFSVAPTPKCLISPHFQAETEKHILAQLIFLNQLTLQNTN